MNPATSPAGPRAGDGPARPRRWGRWLLAALGLLVLVVVLVDWSAIARGWIERAASQATGRTVRIGQLHVPWQLPLRVELRDVSVSNPSWAVSPVFFEAKLAAAEIRLLPLLRGELVVPQAEFDAPRVFLQSQGEQRTWRFEKKAEPDRQDGSFAPRIGHVTVRDGYVQYLDAASDTAAEVSLATEAAGQAAGSVPAPASGPAAQGADASGRAGPDRGGSDPGAPGPGEPARKNAASSGSGEAAQAGDRLLLQAGGRFRGQPLALRGWGGSILRLRDEEPYPLSLEGQLGETRIKADGQLALQSGLEAFELDLALAGPTMQAIGQAFDAAIPDTPPYRVSGHLTRQGGLWRVERLAGNVGDSELAGTVQFEPATAERARPLLTATLVADRLDFDDLAPLVGAPPRTGPGQSASPAQRERAEQLRANEQALPSESFKTDKWRKFDAQVSLQAKRVTHAPALPVDSFSAQFELTDGLAKVSPLQIGLAGGQATAHLTLDGRAEPLSGSLSTRFAGLKLQRMFPTVEQMRDSLGTIYGEVDLKSSGGSIKRLLDEADGSVHLAMAGGRVSNMAMELVGLDAGEVIKYFVRGDREIRIRCALADFDVRDGVASTNALLLDTTDSVVIGNGRIDLGREQLALTFNVRPKDASILVARAPLHLTGSLRKPKIAPDAGALAGRGLAMLALGAINPLLALLPTIETGPGENANCRDLVAQAPRFTQQGALRAGTRDEAKLPPDTTGPDDAASGRAGAQPRAATPARRPAGTAGIGAAPNYPN